MSRVVTGTAASSVESNIVPFGDHAVERFSKLLHNDARLNNPEIEFSKEESQYLPIIMELIFADWISRVQKEDAIGVNSSLDGPIQFKVKEERLPALMDDLDLIYQLEKEKRKQYKLNLKKKLKPSARPEFVEMVYQFARAAAFFFSVLKLPLSYQVKLTDSKSAVGSLRVLIWRRILGEHRFFYKLLDEDIFLQLKNEYGCSEEAILYFYTSSKHAKLSLTIDLTRFDYKDRKVTRLYQCGFTGDQILTILSSESAEFLFNEIVALVDESKVAASPDSVTKLSVPLVMLLLGRSVKTRINLLKANYTSFTKEGSLLNIYHLAYLIFVFFSKSSRISPREAQWIQEQIDVAVKSPNDFLATLDPVRYEAFCFKVRTGKDPHNKITIKRTSMSRGKTVIAGPETQLEEVSGALKPLTVIAEAEINQRALVSVVEKESVQATGGISINLVLDCVNTALQEARQQLALFYNDQPIDMVLAVMQAIQNQCLLLAKYVFGSISAGSIEFNLLRDKFEFQFQGMVSELLGVRSARITGQQQNSPVLSVTPSNGPVPIAAAAESGEIDTNNGKIGSVSFKMGVFSRQQPVLTFSPAGSESESRSSDGSKRLCEEEGGFASKRRKY
jgi:hypothetical protein